MGEIKDWIPLFSKLVWPLFISLLILLFNDQVRGAFSQVIEAVAEGRSVQVGDWLKIGEKTSIAELSAKKGSEIGQSLDISVESVGGYQEFVEKSSYSVLERIQSQLRESPGRRIDVLAVTSSKRYSSELLKSYITTLGIRFVVFQKNGEFDGWLEAGLFNSQLPGRDQLLSYATLRDHLLGVRTESVPSASSAIEVLKAMENVNAENIAVVDGGQFRFIADRGSILSKLMTASLLKQDAAR